MEERPVVLLTWVRHAVVLFAAVVVNMVFDYAKIACATDGSRSAVIGTMRGIGFALRHLRQALALYLLLAAFGIVGLLAYRGITEVTPLLLSGQIYVFFRIWLRLMFFGSQMRLFDVLELPAPEFEVSVQ